MMYPINLTHTIYTGQAANSGPSPKLWSQIRSVGISPDGFARGYYAGSEFMGFGGLLTSTSGDYADQGGSYSSYQDSSCTITAEPTTGGQITIATDGSDNLEAWLQYGSTTNTLGAINTTSGKVTIFETRVKFPTVTAGNAYVGLAEEGLAANSNMADSGGALTDKDYLGFLLKEGAPSTLLFVYGKEGTTATVTTLVSLGTVVLDTFYNLGFIYDPNAVDAKKLKVYMNNAEQTTYGTATTLASADFPTGEELTFLAGVKANGSAVKSMTLDWWHWWQEA